MAKPAATDVQASEAPPAKSTLGKKLIIGAGGLLIVAALGGAGLMYSGILHRPAKAVHKLVPPMDVFVRVPQIVANLNTDGGSTSYIKLKISLAFPNHTKIKPIKARMPEIVDVVQTFLRSETPQALQGRAGTAALRTGIQSRLRMLLAPVKLRRVLFEALIIQ